MPLGHNIVVTFLGTTSGGGPTETRNCSSLVVDAMGDGSLWMVDCAEGTVRQFAKQPSVSVQRLRMNNINRIFITHMHADHSMGLITLLRNVLGIAPDTPPQPMSAGPSTGAARPPKPTALKVEIYGPVGVRAFIRTVLTLTHTKSADRYCVHELLMPGEAPSVSGDVPDDWHQSEVGGRDIPCGDDGFWRNIVIQPRRVGCPVVVNAGPIVHRDPCIGYVFSEQPLQPSGSNGPIPHLATNISTIPRTIVILGDTSNPSALVPLITESQDQDISLLVHEATDAHIPRDIDSRGTTGKNRTHEGVKAKAIAKGHSTPAMAGEFARLIGAKRLALNHIGARFPAPPPRAGPSNFRYACMREIEDQAMREWKPTNGNRAMAVSDFDCIVIPPVIRQPPGNPPVSEHGEIDLDMTGAVSTIAEVMQGPRDQSHVPGRSGNIPHNQHGNSRYHPERKSNGKPYQKRVHNGDHDKNNHRGSASRNHRGAGNTNVSSGSKKARLDEA